MHKTWCCNQMMVYPVQVNTVFTRTLLSVQGRDPYFCHKPWSGYFKSRVCSRFSVCCHWKPSKAIESEFLLLTPNTVLLPVKIYVELQESKLRKYKRRWRNKNQCKLVAFQCILCGFCGFKEQLRKVNYTSQEVCALQSSMFITMLKNVKGNVMLGATWSCIDALLLYLMPF